MSEIAHAQEVFGIQAGVGAGENAGSHGRLLVRKYDEEMVAYVSRKLGGGLPGHPDFVNPSKRDFDQLKIDPYEIVESLPNLFTTGGWQRIMNLMNAASGTGTGSGWASAACRIGVGTATGAAANTNNDLSAATGPTNRFFKLVTGAGTTGTGTGAGNSRLSFVSTFASGDANFVWAEWCIDAGTGADGTGAATTPMMNRAVSALGTKASPAVWTATAQLDFG